MNERKAIMDLQEYIGSGEYNGTNPPIYLLTANLAIDALEKQIAKKVHVPPCNACENDLCDCECEHFGKTFIDNFKCPICDSKKICITEYDVRYDFCPDCGQKLDWSEV